MISGNVLRIAPNQNNVVNLTSLHKIHADLFKYHSGQLMTFKWSDYEDRELNADKRYKRIGRPVSEVTIPYFSFEALKAFKTLLCTGEDALVTVRTMRMSGGLRGWANFNGKLELPNTNGLRYDGLGWYDYVLIFSDLKAL